MTSIKSPLAVPLAIIMAGAGWFLMGWHLVVNSVPWYWEGVNWLWTLALGVIGILMSVLRGIDKGSAVFALVFLLACVMSGLQSAWLLPLGVLAPLALMGIGTLVLFIQISALSNPTRRRAREVDPLGQRVNGAGCVLYVAGFLVSGLGGLVWLANGLAMEGSKENLARLAIGVLIGGIALMCLGGIVALTKRDTKKSTTQQGRLR
jgi:hypothetical protein